MSTLNLGELAIYVRETPALPVEKQNVWNLVGRGKATMDFYLQRSALALQQVLAGYETKDQPALEAALKAYKAGYAEMEGIRKQFTQYLDAAKKQCMKIEDAYDPKVYEPFVKATAQELKLRQDAATTKSATDMKATEEAEFKTFVEMEYLDIVDDYKHELRQLIHQTYTACLYAKTPSANIQPAINTCVAAMQTIQPRKMKTFARTVLTTEDATPIFKAIRRPDYGAKYSEMIKELQDKFALYANDLANPEQAVAKQTDMFAQVEAQEKSQTEADKAAVTLVNTAAAMSVTTAGTKGVTEVTEIVIEDYSWPWVVAIDAAFAANLGACKDKVKVKKLSGLTVAQKAAALDAASIKVISDHVKYQTIQK